MSQVLDLGASLRQAQSDLDGDALRELTRQRRQLTTAVTRQGRTLAGELGQKVTEAVADQVQDTLHAAMVDEDAAAAVRSGLLVSALAATGVGSADVVDAVAVPAAIGMTPRPRAMPERKRPELSVVPDPEPAPDDAEREREAARRPPARRSTARSPRPTRPAARSARRRSGSARCRRAPCRRPRSSRRPAVGSRSSSTSWSRSTTTRPPPRRRRRRRPSGTSRRRRSWSRRGPRSATALSPRRGQPVASRSACSTSTSTQSASPPRPTPPIS